MITTEPAAPGRRTAFWLAALAAIIVAGVDAAWTYWQFGGERATQYWSDLIAVPVPAATAVVCWVAARRREGRARRAWILLGAAAMSWAIGEAIWSYYELGLGREVPFPSLADVGFLGLIPLAVAGMLSFPAAPAGLTARTRTILDGLIITGSLLFVSWETVLGPTYRESSGTLETLIGLAYPIGDVAIFSIVLFIALRVARGHRGALVFIGAGLGVLALADSGFIYQNLHNSYASGSLIDPLWEIGFLLMMLGGVLAIPHAETATDVRGPHPVSQLLPYIGVVTVVVSAAVLRVNGPLEIVLFWTMLAVLLFVVARQLLTMYDNVTLTRTLESRVRELVDHDIAERERAEREREELQTHLNHARRLESLGQMAGAISHDFNNILGVILGFASLTRGELDERLKNASPEDRAAIALSLEQIENAAERAANLTSQLVTFGRREPSQMRVIDLNRIIREFEPFLRRTVSESVELRLEPAPEAMMIEADPAQIEQVLTNLALNARDAMPDGGRLTISTSAAMVDEDQARFHPGLIAGRHIRLTVRDTGEGMDADVAARAFDPFFTTKPKGAGAGLGLASAYGIVSQAGGTIRVDSAPGAGATFTIHLPASEDAASPEPVRSIRLETTPGSGGRILVVEDDPSMRMLLAVTLRESGYEVVQAGNGAEALAAAEGSGPIDAVLTDVVMPQMSGPELIAHLRRTRPDLPAVCMSGYAEPVVNPGNIADGVRFIGKPFTMVQLLAAVREVLHPAPARP